MTYYAYINAHGYMFQGKSQHRQDECTWCRQAKDTALDHMRDANLKTTKSIKREPDDTTHEVHLTRLHRILGVGTRDFESPLYGTTYRAPFGSTIGLGEGLKVRFNETLPADLSGTYVKTDPARPVVFQMTESEAATVLRLLDAEEENQTDEADAAYQNGDGFEGECVQARQMAAEAETIADRLRKTIGDHLDKAYAGELES